MSEPTGPRVFPWEKQYATDSNPVPPNVVMPWNRPQPTPQPAPEPAVEPSPVPVVVDPPVPAPGPVPAPVTPTPVSAPVPAGTFAQQLESELEAVVRHQADVVLASAQQAALNAAKAHGQGPGDPATTAPVEVNVKSFTNAAARSRAIRSLVIGLGMAVLWGVVTAIGTAGRVDFFTKAGWTSFFVLIGGAALNSAISYIARLRIDPGLD